MTPNELELLLQRWGLAVHRGSADVSGQHGYGTNPIAVGMEYALGSRSAVLRSMTNMDRAGDSRRRHMADRAEAEQDARRMHAVPTWACDPVPARGTRHAARTSEPWFPPELERVHRAVMELFRFDNLRGACIICEYQLHWMTQAEKAVEVSKRQGAPIKLKRYRDELAHGRTWLHGRLIAVAA